MQLLRIAHKLHVVIVVAMERADIPLRVLVYAALDNLRQALQGRHVTLLRVVAQRQRVRNIVPVAANFDGVLELAQRLVELGLLSCLVQPCTHTPNKKK